MSIYYYKSPTSLTESLVCLHIAEGVYSPEFKASLEEHYNTPVAVWSHTLPFSGYPIVEDDIMRQATVTELIEAGVRVLKDNEVLLDGAIVKLAWNEEVVDGVVVEKVFPTVEPTPLTTEQLAERVRRMRDDRITSCNWIVSRHAKQMDLGVATTLTANEYTAWLTYRQELRDLPSEDGFPWDGGGYDTPWPVEPVA
ncbi:MAG: phage tail assembly chaperone [Pseudomonadota bacterium]